MNLILETDLGRDPDDFFAICYLVSSGINVRCILITPGDPDQIAVARFICNRLKINPVIGTPDPLRNKQSSGGVHYDILKHFNFPLTAQADGVGKDVLGSIFDQYPDIEILTIGPMTNLYRYLKDNPRTIKRMTVQGGFLPFSVHEPKNALDKFSGMGKCPSFNLNGDPKAALFFADYPVEDKTFVSKNICHSVVYNRETHSRFVVQNEADELFKLTMDMYLNHHPEKKFHDPLAAACHLNQKLAQYVHGHLFREKGEWSWRKNDLSSDKIIAELNADDFWKSILTRK